MAQFLLLPRPGSGLPTGADVRCASAARENPSQRSIAPSAAMHRLKCAAARSSDGYARAADGRPLKPLPTPPFLVRSNLPGCTRSERSGCSRIRRSYSAAASSGCPGRQHIRLKLFRYGEAGTLLARLDLAHALFSLKIDIAVKKVMSCVLPHAPTASDQLRSAESTARASPPEECVRAPSDPAVEASLRA